MTMFIIYKVFLKFYKPHIFAGLKAENVFEKQAMDNSWLVEKIPQDKKSFKKYTKIRKKVKRADFMCRNCNGVEIEVKCKTQYGSVDNKYYLIDYADIKKHLEMKKITNEKVVFAFYERNGANVDENSLRMVDLDFLLKTYDYKAGKLYDAKNKSIKILLKYTRPKFLVLEILKSRKTQRS